MYVQHGRVVNGEDILQEMRALRVMGGYGGA